MANRRILTSVIGLVAGSLLFMSGCTDRSDGGTFSVAVSEDAVILGNPPTIMKQSDPDLAAPAIERLFRRDRQGEPVPFLADSYQVADDHLSITIELKQGIKFHDGSDFNAKVAKWNLDRYIATERAELAKVQSVEVTGDYTIELRLSEYDGLLLQYLSAIPGMMVSRQSIEEHGEEWAETHPVGTGAYRYVKWDRDQRIVYEAFDGYWQGEPKLDELIVEVIADPFAQKASLETGEVDAIMSLSPKDANELKQAGQYQVNASELAASVLGLLPDSANPDSVYSSLLVRQAVWHAIDFEAIANTLGYGYHEPTVQLATEASGAYNPDVQGYPYDPNAAKALLKEAGYESGFATTLYGQNTPAYSDILTAVQAFLQEVGIEAKVELVDQGKYFEMLTGGPEKGGWKDGMTIVPFTIVPNELGAYSRLLGPGVSAARLPVLYNSDELQGLIGNAAKEADPARTKEIIHQMQKTATDDHATLFWIYAAKNISAVRPDVKGANFSTPQWTPEQISLED
jgi:peptide/nickel transport system substrate-binding protein